MYPQPQLSPAKLFSPSSCPHSNLVLDTVYGDLFVLVAASDRNVLSIIWDQSLVDGWAWCSAGSAAEVAMNSYSTNHRCNKGDRKEVVFQVKICAYLICILRHKEYDDWKQQTIYKFSHHYGEQFNSDLDFCKNDSFPELIFLMKNTLYVKYTIKHLYKIK